MEWALQLRTRNVEFRRWPGLGSVQSSHCSQPSQCASIAMNEIRTTKHSTPQYVQSDLEPQLLHVHSTGWAQTPAAYTSTNSTV